MNSGKRLTRRGKFVQRYNITKATVYTNTQENKTSPLFSYHYSNIDSSLSFK